MANPTFKRIKDLSLEKTSVADNDWFVLEDSEDSFKTKKVKGQYIGANIYKNDGTLTGNRTVTMSGNSLTFSGGAVKTISPSASALDTAFSIRNNTNTADLLLVKANGGININQATATSTQISAKSNNSDYWVLGLQDASNNDIVRFGVAEIELRKITAIGGGNIAGIQLAVYGKQRSINLPTYADNAAALAGGLVADDEYKTATGERRIVV